MNMAFSNEEVGFWNLIVIIENSSEQTAVLAVDSEEYTHRPVRVILLEQVTVTTFVHH